MDYDEEISSIIAVVKTDKAIRQPWRNKSVARLEEVQAFIRMGLNISNLKPPEDEPIDLECICPEGGVRTTCPVHGTI